MPINLRKHLTSAATSAVFMRTFTIPPFYSFLFQFSLTLGRVRELLTDFVLSLWEPWKRKRKIEGNVILVGVADPAELQPGALDWRQPPHAGSGFLDWAGSLGMGPRPQG